MSNTKFPEGSVTDRPHITILDTTLRDGEQSPGCSMNVQEKLRLAQQLDRLGVDVIEAGFPIASDGDFEAVRKIAARRAAPHHRGPGPRLHRLTSIVPGTRSSRAARPRIHVFLATSDIHLKYKLRITREQCLDQAGESRCAREVAVRRRAVLARRRDAHRCSISVQKWSRP